MGLMPYSYSAYSLSIASDIQLPPLRVCEPGAADLTIKCRKIPQSPATVSTKIYRAGLNARFAQNGNDQVWLDWPPLISFMALNGNELVVETTQTDAELISLFTLSEALGFILFQKGYFLLHGSAVRIGDEGVVFLGEPGAGKSTTVAAFAKKGCRVISDDMVCIQLNETGPHLLIPAFPQIKIWKNSVDGLQLQQEQMLPVREGIDKFSWQNSIEFEDKPLPLKHIVVLTPPNAGPDCVMNPVATSQIPVALLQHFPLADAILTGETLNDYFGKSVAIAKSTPLSYMSRPANFTTLGTFVEHLIAT